MDTQDTTPEELTNDVEYQELVRKSLKAQQLLRGGRTPKKVLQLLDLPKEMLGQLTDLQRELVGDVSKRSYTTASLSDVQRKKKRKAQRAARKAQRRG